MAATARSDGDGPSAARPPLPVSIAVRNLFPPLAAPDPTNDESPVDTTDEEDGNGSADEAGERASRPTRRLQSIDSFPSSPMEDRCALASREVLLRLRLDVVARRRRLRDGEEGVSGEETVLCSLERPRRAAHPRWDHVDELLATKSLDPNDKLFARFVILDDSEDGGDGAPSDGGKEEWVLAEVPLHPSKLRRLPAADGGNVGTDNDRSSGGGAMTIPHTLPPNTILLHYNDGYTRVLPDVYWLLVQKGIITESVMDPIKRSGSGGYKGHGTDGVGGTKSMFEEKAFNVLGEPILENDIVSAGSDDEKGKDGKDADEAKENLQLMYDNDRVFDLLGKPSTESEEAQPERENRPVANEGDESSMQDRALDLAAPIPSAQSNAAAADVGVENNEKDAPELVPEPAAESSDNSATNESSKLDSEPGIGKIEGSVSSSSLPVSEPLSALPVPSSADDEDATMKVMELRRLVEMERQLLEEEQRRVSRGNDQLKSIMEQVQRLESETEEFMRAVGAERTNLFRSEFRLEAHRIRLLQHLQLIFPLKLAPINIPANPPHYPQHQYTIAGLPLPDDVHNTTITDDQVSTALGFLCHLVSLTSKYLAIPLRFPIVCKFSRSAILFDRGRGDVGSSRVVYPLFRERGVIDREQLDYGVLLLERDIDCLLNVRNVEFQPDWNALAKMDKLLGHVIDGAEPTVGVNAG